MASILIIGGGLGGLACARRLVDRQHHVTVLEARPYLGGRASTFRDGDGEWVEQGLHVFLGIYREFLELLNGIGQTPERALFWMDEVTLCDPRGPKASFGVNPVQSPVKTILSVVGQNDFLSPHDKLALARMAAPAATSWDLLRRHYENFSVAEYWKRIGGSEDLLDRVLRPFCRAIQFTEAEQFSAFDFLGWVHHALYHLPSQKLAGYTGARDETIFAPLGRYLTDRGATIRTNASVATLEADGATGEITAAVLATGERLTADHYVLALPGWLVSDVLPPRWRDASFFQQIAELPTAPAISVQLWFDQIVTGSPDYVLIARTVTPVYQEQSPRTYPVAEGTRVSVIVSPADEWLSASDQDLERIVVESLASVNPSLTSARVTKRHILRHERHLIRPLPGVMSRRPGQQTPVRNLFLAGDWTQQEFFGSQEGAVRGGNRCAEAILAAIALTPIHTTVPD